MRKMILAGLMAATLAPVAATAQTYELNHDRRDVREARRDLRDARREYREDSWRDYRTRNPNLYRGPAYVGPRGYVYRPVNVGYRFAPGYYDRRYWIDPARYRLPLAGRNERWVRYGRDVVRVDVRNGRALQIYSGFFY